MFIAWLLLAGATLGLTLLVLLLYRRTRQAHDQLARDAHDRALALSQRADYLQAQLDQQAMDRRVDQLRLLVSQGEAEQRLPAAVAHRLRAHLLQLNDQVALPPRH